MDMVQTHTHTHTSTLQNAEAHTHTHTSTLQNPEARTHTYTHTHSLTPPLPSSPPAVPFAGMKTYVDPDTYEDPTQAVHEFTKEIDPSTTNPIPTDRVLRL